MKTSRLAPIALLLFSLPAFAGAKATIECGSQGIGNEVISGEICRKKPCGISNLRFHDEDEDELPAKAGQPRGAKMTLIRYEQDETSILIVAEIPKKLLYVFSVDWELKDLGMLKGQMTKVIDGHITRMGANCEVSVERAPGPRQH